MNARVVTFGGLDFLAGPGALAPRQETELLAREALAAMADIDAPRVVDVCCGTGNLACVVASARPDAQVWASDLAGAAARFARENIAALGLGRRVSLFEGDLFAPLLGESLEGTIDIIVCNPPYLSTATLAARADLAGEPREAFDGGPYGLSIHQRVIREGLALLRPKGALLFELGVGQERQVELLFRRAGAYGQVTFSRDPSGAPRVALARKKE